MSEACTVGLDIGSTFVKAVLVGSGGDELATARRPTPWTGSGGYAEITGPSLLETVTRVLADLAEDADGQPVAAIGVSGMAEAGALLDADDEARGPVIAWFDRRGADELPLIPDDVHRDFPGRTGLPLVELATFAKLWHRIRTEDLALDGLQWHNVPELVVRWLGGGRYAEPSLAARTGLLDQDTGAVWPRAVEVLGTTADLVPPLLAAGSVWGHATSGVPPAMAGAVLSVAGHDHLVSCVASGIVDLDTMYDSMGTAEALIRVLDGVLDRDARARLAAHGVNVLRHLLPGRGVMLAATKSGLLMRRVLQLVGVHDAAGRAALDEQVMLLPDDPTGVAVTGAKNDDGVLAIRADTDGLSPALLFEASLRHGCEVLEEVLAVMDAEHPPATRSVLAGGWVGMSSVRRSRERILPDVRFSERAEDTAYGAALIAAFAADPAADDLASYLSVATGPCESDPHHPGEGSTH